jgi:hypothetical protein
MTEEQIIKITTNNVFETLRKQGFKIKEEKNIFQRTEQLLYTMPQLKKAINHNKERIEELKTFGIAKKGSAVHKIPTSTPKREDEEELIRLKINEINQRNHIINSTIKWVNGILENIKKDKYYVIIDLRYFKGIKTYEDIISEMIKLGYKEELGLATISRNRNRLINEISVLLFGNDYIGELGC